MKIFEAGRDPQTDIDAAIAPVEIARDETLTNTVYEIIADVRKRGNVALLEYGQKFDSPELESIAVTDHDFEEAYASVSRELLDAIETARTNIWAYHRHQIRNSWVDIHEGRILGQQITPLDRVGVYAPGGKAPYPSSVLMTVVPAKVAGVPEVILCCPAQRDGKIHPAMLVAAKECGATSIFKVGGAQAIAAMAYGTTSIPRVDKICGPGNPYVTEAKRQVFGQVGIDMLAGPSEVLVIADDASNPAFVAADLLSQAEHAEDSRVVLVTVSRQLADAVLGELRKQRQTLSRKEIAGKSLDEYGVVIIARNLDEAVDIANQFAPEHLEIMTTNPWEILPRVKHAGSVMLGGYTPVPLTDFAAGTNHVLPTNGTARFSSPLGVDDFIKKTSVTWFSPQELGKISHTVELLADTEGFEAHAHTVRIRREEA